MPMPEVPVISNNAILPIKGMLRLMLRDVATAVLLYLPLLLL